MRVSESEESSRLLDEKLLRFMEQLELLEEKRAALNALIEQVAQWRTSATRAVLKNIYICVRECTHNTLTFGNFKAYFFF